MLASRALRVAVLGAAFAVASSVGAVIDGLSSDVTTMQSFKSKLQPGIGLRFVRNSGVCETTPGVNQLSGYVDFAPNSSMVSLRFVHHLYAGALIRIHSGFGSSKRDKAPRLHHSPCGMLLRAAGATVSMADIVVQAQRRSRLLIDDRFVPGCVRVLKQGKRTFNALRAENGPCHVNEDGVTTTLNPFRYALPISSPSLWR